MSVTSAPARPEDPLLASADRAAEAALRELPEALVLVFDGRLRTLRAGGAALDRVGEERALGAGVELAKALPAELWREARALFESALEGETRSRELWLEEDGRCLELELGPARAAAADGAAGVALLLDATARRGAELLAGARRSPQALTGAGGAPVLGLLDMEGRWLLASRALCDLTGYTPAELAGSRLEQIVHAQDARADGDQRRRLLDGEGAAYRRDWRVYDAAGETLSTIASVSLVRERGGSPLCYAVQVQDVSERRRLEQELRGLSDHDPLTGLRNARLFAHDLRLQVARSRRYGEVAGLMVLDVDLPGLGAAPAAEEAALGAVARALTRRLRETDLVARIGARRLAVLLPHIDEQGLAVVGDGVERAVLACSVDVGRLLARPAPSVGSTVIDRGCAGAEQALLAADRAVRSARRCD